MSENYGSTSPSGTGGSGTVDTAKQEAKDLTSTATSEAGNVVGTAKDQVASVAQEAKSQAKDLYRQTTRELRDQADAQQQRLASGLRSVGDQLGSMAGNAEEPGLASEIVQQVSQRVGSAASWLGDRDPAALLDEVKRYARRKPGTFIAVAAVAGVVVGRLTRALAAAASDEKESAAATSSAPALSAPAAPAAPAAPVAAPGAQVIPPAPAAPVADTPLYSGLTSTSEGELPGEGNRV
jgi:ElaB/YqjD/DUF883 family membrane-anchored ribosome-binding protein